MRGIPTPYLPIHGRTSDNLQSATTSYRPIGLPPPNAADDYVGVGVYIAVMTIKARLHTFWVFTTGHL